MSFSTYEFSVRAAFVKFTRCPQTNFHPNDGECVSPNTFPPNEFSVAALSGRPVSYRFFLNGNSQACKGGVTTAAFIPNQNAQEGVSKEPFWHVFSR